MTRHDEQLRNAEHDEERPVEHVGRGLLITGLLGPLMLLGGLMAASALISALLAGWLPSEWFSDSPADWLTGTGATGDASNYIRFMIGAVTAYASYRGIRWGFIGP